MFPPKRERGLDYAAAMAVRWMAASRYKPYEIAIHDFVESHLDQRVCGLRPLYGFPPAKG